MMCDCHKKKNMCCQVTTRTDDMFAILELNQIEDEVTYKGIVEPNQILDMLLNGELPSYNTLQIFLNMCLQKLDSFIESHGQLINLNISTNIFVFGDIHGQFNDLNAWFKKTNIPSRHNKDKFLFLGDYVDRGKDDVEVIILLLVMKYMHPSKVFLLRGNHESCLQNCHYGFKSNCIRHYKSNGLKIWKKINEIFDCLPRSALINKKIFCIHGGLSPEFFKDDFKTLKNLKQYKKDKGFDRSGILTDLYWADPNEMKMMWKKNPRGISYEFNLQTVNEFHKKFNTRKILRAHQMVDGVEHFGNGLMTVFSAPNYGRAANKGAIVKINQRLNLQIIYLSP